LQGFEEVLSDRPYPASTASSLTLHGYGYRWFRRTGSKQ
jgi:maltose alpha-D-glucosyltransferase/alpha-amylase